MRPRSHALVMETAGDGDLTSAVDTVDKVVRIVDPAGVPVASEPGGDNHPKVAILLCTYQGQSFLAEQLDSFAAQTHANWEVLASDDGSRDGTRAILERYQQQWGEDRLTIVDGPRQGVVANFLSLVCQAQLRADYFAFSDQDDIWEADKLQRALSWLQQAPADLPALYCSRTRMVDASGQARDLSPLFARRPSFANALVQSLAGGNTMVFNEPVRSLLREAGSDVDVVSHDWWAYMVVTGCGGKVHYDPVPSLRYRQHDANLIGGNVGWLARSARIGMLLQGRFRSLSDRNIAALARLYPRLTEESRQVLDQFAVARQSGLFRRVGGVLRSGVYRQTLPGNLALWLATLLKKI